jgi:hypothetical protein
MAPLWLPIFTVRGSWLIYNPAMSKDIPLIPTEIVLRELSKLDGAIRLIPAQVSMVLGISKCELDEKRENGLPPPAIMEGDKIRYRVDAVRAYAKSAQAYKPATPIKVVPKPESRRLGGFHLIESFNSFMTHGGLNDRFPFVIIKGWPIDLYSSLSMELDDDEADGRWLTLEEYLSMRLDFAIAEKVKAEDIAMRGVADGDYPALNKTRLGQTTKGASSQ